MKKWYSVILIVCILGLSAMLFFGLKEEDSLDNDMVRFLHTEGVNIKDGTGATVALRGVNLGGWLIQEAWMCPTEFDGYFQVLDIFTERFGEQGCKELIDVWEDNYITEEDFDNIKALGCNSVRLPFTWRTLQNSDYSYKEDAFARLDWAIEECAKRQLYIVLDLHGAHGSQNGRHHSGQLVGELYSCPENMERTEELWVRIANRYKDNPWVAAYDLLNEPEGQPGESLGKAQKDYYKRLYNAIRTVDAKHIITIEAVWEPTVMPNPQKEGYENVVYQYHFYGWDNTNNYEYQKAFTNSKVLLLKLSYGAGVPCYVGEFTYFGLAESWDYALNLYNKQGWSWSIWTYKVNGLGSSWGLYTAQTEKVYPETDSYNEIVRKWSQVQTGESYQANTWLTDIVKAHS